MHGNRVPAIDPAAYVQLILHKQFLSLSIDIFNIFPGSGEASGNQVSNGFPHSNAVAFLWTDADLATEAFMHRLT